MPSICHTKPGPRLRRGTHRTCIGEPVVRRRDPRPLVYRPRRPLVWIFLSAGSERRRCSGEQTATFVMSDRAGGCKIRSVDEMEDTRHVVDCGRVSRCTQLPPRRRKTSSTVDPFAPAGCDASDALRDRGTDLDGSVGNAARSALQGSHGQPEPTARLGGGRRRNDDPIEQTSYEANEPRFPRA